MVHAISNPITYYALLAIGLGLCLYLFVTVKADIAALRTSQAIAEATRKQLDGEPEPRRGLPPAERSLLPATNTVLLPAVLSPGKREQALRLAAHGKTPEEIAKALNVPPCETELLLKVHRMAFKSPRSEGLPDQTGILA